MDSTEQEWYYVDIDGAAKGPITTEDVKELPLDVFVWNGTTVNQWTELKEILSLVYDDDDDEDEDDEPNNVHCKPKLKNYWSITNKMNQINVESPSISIIPKIVLDFSKRAIPESNPVEIKSNLAQQLKHIVIEQDDSPHSPTQQQNAAKSRLGIKQSVTDIANAFPPQFNPDDVVTAKLEQIMATLKMTEHARIAMRDMSENKKLQVILEYDFARKSELLKKKNVLKKKRPIFKKKKKKKSVSSSKSKEWKFGFNPLPIMVEQDEISSTIQSMSLEIEQKESVSVSASQTQPPMMYNMKKGAKEDEDDRGTGTMSAETSVNSNNSNTENNDSFDESAYDIL